jgi:hypothetical protein
MAAVILCSVELAACAARPNTNRFVVVAEPHPSQSQTWQEHCALACDRRARAGERFVDCHSVGLPEEVVEQLNHSSQYGVACEFR